MNAPVRREDQRFLTGKGRYADNTAPTEALVIPGVAAIYTAEDTAADRLGHLPAISEIKDAEGNRHREPPHLPMPVGKVRHVGDLVAMVVAETLDQARDAAEALAVDYEPLPAVVTVAQA